MCLETSAVCAASKTGDARSVIDGGASNGLADSSTTMLVEFPIQSANMLSGHQEISVAS